jgi:hypothetical protein
MPRKTSSLAASLALGALLCSPSPAAAQLTPSGSSFLVASALVRGTASAYDSRNNAFLAVGAHGGLTGRLVKPDGTFAGNPFRIDLATGFVQYPSVAYSPHVDAGRGGFLVTWHQDEPGNPNNFVHCRLVSATGAFLTSVFTLGTEGTWWEGAANVEYATTSQVFMVTWRTFSYQIRAARVNITGQNLDAGSNPGTPLAGAGILVSRNGGERDPSLAYNPGTDTFLVAYGDFLGGSHAYSRLVSAASGGMGPLQLLGAGITVYLTHTTFSSGANKYVVGWYQGGSGPTARFVDANGTPTGTPIPMSSRFCTYDSFGIAYNALTQSSLFVGHDNFSPENGGGELTDAGVPATAMVLTNAAGSGNFYPQVSASTTEGKWMLTTAHNFSGIVAQFAVAPVAFAAPAITRNPVNVTARIGEMVTFTAAASGGPAPAVQWETNTGSGGSFVAISGATTPTYSFPASRADTRKLYRAHFANGLVPDAFSAAARLVVAGAPADVDGDGKSDPLVWRTGTGEWLSPASASSTSSTGSIVWGNSNQGDIPLNGDMDGDGITDPVVWRPVDGTWYWLTSSTNFSTARQVQKAWGNAALGDVPLLADMDGDGLADPIVWRASTGVWYWLTSSTGYTYESSQARQWGAGRFGDIPLNGDFDGDGKADLVIWRPTDGTFYWLTSSSGYSYAAQGQKQWGLGSLGDKPFVANLDFDKKADLVIWRPSTGTWYWLISSAAYSYVVQGQKQWGSAALGDVPMLNDFDGDGRADLTVWRPRSGTWFWLTSSSGYLAPFSQLFGGLGDIPIR